MKNVLLGAVWVIGLLTSSFQPGFVGGPPGALAGTARIGQDVDIGLVGVNYRWGGAPAARY
ncbi:hypothetical protein [Bradyrhizobium elkanii]|uniref:hypothetical protein n=1 Tax=Bradyrhizobium elkanii TaxID=29448 RepID=UPI003511E2A5